MALTAAIILLYLVALFLTIATLWPISYPTNTIFPKETNPQFVWVLILAGIPFVMLIYFGSAFLISDTISDGAAWLTSETEPSFTEGLVASVCYVGLSGWLWLRWRNPKAPSARIVGPTIIATLIIFIIVSVIWAAHNGQIF